MIKGNPNMIPDSEFFSDNMRKKANVFRIDANRFMLERFNMSRAEPVRYFKSEQEAEDAAEDWVNS